MKTESKKSSPPANLLGQQQNEDTAIGHSNKQDHKCPEARPPLPAQGTSIGTSKSWVSPPSPNYTNTVHRTPLSPSSNKETRNALKQDHPSQHTGPPLAPEDTEQAPYLQTSTAQCIPRHTQKN